MDFAFEEAAEAAEIRASAQRRRLESVRHYSPLSQVASVLDHGGIHPRRWLRALGVTFNDDWRRWASTREKSEELVDYTAVSVISPWGMMKDDPDCVVFAIAKRQLWRKGTAFIGGWSSTRDIRGRADVEAREGVEAFDSMFDNPSSNWPAPIPGEILVRGSIPLSDCGLVYVRSQEHLAQLRAAVRESGINYRGPSMKARIDRKIFHG